MEIIKKMEENKIDENAVTFEATETVNATAPMVAEGGLKVAYIDTDTLLTKYQYAIDLVQQL